MPLPALTDSMLDTAGVIGRVDLVGRGASAWVGELTRGVGVPPVVPWAAVGWGAAAVGVFGIGMGRSWAREVNMIPAAGSLTSNAPPEVTVDGWLGMV